jgi:hypothetical protein
MCSSLRELQPGRTFAVSTFVLIRSTLIASSLIALVSLVGCAEPPPEGEEQGGSASEQVAYPKNADDRKLDAIEAKVQSCQLLTDADWAQLDRYNEVHVNVTFEGYLSFTCSIEGGEIVVGNASVSQRWGYSSADGAFSEQATDVSVGVTIPLGAVDIHGALTSSQTVRESANAGVVYGSSNSVSAGVGRKIGVAEGSADVSFDSNGNMALSGSLSVPVPVKMSDCLGKEKLGVTVTLSAHNVLDTHGLSTPAAKALQRRAISLGEVDIGNSHLLVIPNSTAAERADAKKRCCDARSGC